MEVNVVTKDDRRKLDKILNNFDNTNFSDYIGLFSEINEKATQKGIFNEFGTAKAPARPFVEPTYLKNEKWMIQQVKKNLKKFNSPKVFMTVMSEELVDKTKHTIDVMKYPQLAESTIIKKGNDKLLIDTKEMYEAITTTREENK